jgi:hypothetical protein
VLCAKLIDVGVRARVPLAQSSAVQSHGARVPIDLPYLCLGLYLSVVAAAAAAAALAG